AVFMDTLRLVGDDFLHVTPVMTVHVTLVRPFEPEVGPAAGTPLHGGAAYPVHTLVPSLAALGHAPSKTEIRYPPSNVAQLRQLGRRTVPLGIDGADGMFEDARQVLIDYGFLPSGHDTPRLADRLGHHAVGDQLLENLGKFDDMRSVTGLRASVREAIEGGVVRSFMLP
ncbi:hypothetical protein ACW9HQ_53470, partial [Nocardia gipuzkoensis]